MKVSELKAALVGVPDDAEVQFSHPESGWPQEVTAAAYQENPRWQNVENYRAHPTHYPGWVGKPNDELHMIFLID